VRVERGGAVEQRGEVFDVQRAEVVEREGLLVGRDLAPDVLQRAQPVPVRDQPVEAEAHPPRRFGRGVVLLVRRERVLGRPVPLHHAREREDAREADEDDGDQRRVGRLKTAHGSRLFGCLVVARHLKLRRLKMSVAAASRTAT
jgi:hypothetical protein